MLAYPIVLYPLIQSLDHLQESAHHGARTAASHVHGFDAPLLDAAQDDAQFPTASTSANASTAASTAASTSARRAAFVRRMLQSLLVISSTILIAVLIGRRLNVVISALGGTVGAALVCWFPSALLVAQGRHAERAHLDSPTTALGRAGRAGAVAMLVMLGLLAALGTAATIMAHAQDNAQGSAHDSAHGRARADVFTVGRQLGTPFPTAALPRALLWLSFPTAALPRALLWLSRASVALALGYFGRRLLTWVPSRFRQFRPLLKWVPSRFRQFRPRLKLVPLGPNLGVQACDPNLGVQACELSPSTVAGLSDDDPRLWELGEALREHSLLRLRRVNATEPPLTPQQLRNVYVKVHRACHPSVPLILPKPRANVATAASPMAAMAAVGSDQRVHASAHHSGADPRARRNLRNLRGETFSDFPETNVLGFAEEVTWHGLRGRLEPTAWWEKIATDCD